MHAKRLIFVLQSCQLFSGDIRGALGPVVGLIQLYQLVMQS
jgi:hypothetical protein